MNAACMFTPPFEEDADIATVLGEALGLQPEIDLASTDPYGPTIEDRQ